MSLVIKNYEPPKVVVIGSASVDFTTYAPRLPTPGETLHGTKFTTSFGGKGANQCVAASKLGANAYMISRVGDDQWGEKVINNLKLMGVDVSHTFITKNMSTGIAQITVAKSGENQIVIVPSANGVLSKQDVEKSKDVIKSASVLIGQLETPFETTLEAFKLCKGVKILNAAPARNDIREILPLCSILCLNKPEAAIVSDLDVVDAASAVDALRKILSFGCDTVIITLGEFGALYGSKTEPPTHVGCPEIDPVDTTGAGDAFVGALGAFLVSHKDLPLHQLIGAACEVATISATKEGTQTSYPNDYKPFTRKYSYEVV